MIAGLEYPAVGVCFQCWGVFPHGNVAYLLSLRSNNCRDERGRWDPGGGKVELFHSISHTLRSEVREEYGVDIHRADFLGVRDVFRQVDSGGVMATCHWIMFDFKVQVNPQKVRIGEPHKCDALHWSDLEHLPEPLHSQMPEFLRLYRDKLFDYNYRNQTCLLEK